MDTAGHLKKSVVNFALRANESGKSKPRLCVRCAIRLASGNWKVSWKQRKLSGPASFISPRNFDGPTEFNLWIMKREDDQELWDLLGQAAEPKVSPYFARNVSREVRQASGWTTFRGWLNPRRLI